ncbi:mannose-1-phosphate guanylyltransferase [Micrococcales bacterium 31B]|nr:mannose-1-phosphate guanylyltransferase [Micrococcales bacterium 31B]
MSSVSSASHHPSPPPEGEPPVRQETPFEHFYAIVPAGGSGVRLWPLSRRNTPKFLMHAPGEEQSLLQGTVERLRAVLPLERIIVVTGVAHADAVREHLPDLPEQNLVSEPSPRDSMAAIGLATALIARRDPAATVGSFASDHIIEDVPAFHAAIAEAIEVAAQGLVVTIGIEPQRPATGFGYILAGDAVPGAPSARTVLSFVEKPDAETARDYVESGKYQWNAGMFVSRADVLIEHLRGQQSGLAKGIDKLVAAWGGPSHAQTLEAVWPSLTRIAIDHAIAEPVAARGGVAVVPAEFGWDDIGDYQALLRLAVARGVRDESRPGVVADAEVAELLGRSAPEIADHLAQARPGTTGLMVRLGQRGTLVDVDSTGVAVLDSARVVATLGVQDVVVVDAEDVLLVAALERAQDLKTLVARLEERAGKQFL